MATADGIPGSGPTSAYTGRVKSATRYIECDKRPALRVGLRNNFIHLCPGAALREFQSPHLQALPVRSENAAFPSCSTPAMKGRSLPNKAARCRDNPFKSINSRYARNISGLAPICWIHSLARSLAPEDFPVHLDGRSPVWYVTIAPLISSPSSRTVACTAKFTNAIV